MRIESGKLQPQAKRGNEFHIVVDGEPLLAHEGESVAAALIAACRLTFRHTAKLGSPRGVYCGIGLCHECRMVIDGVPNVRACLTPARPGMVVDTLQEAGSGRVDSCAK